MSAKVKETYAHFVIKDTTDHKNILCKLQSVYRGRIETINYKRLPHGVVETVDLYFQDLSMVRVTLWVGDNGKSKTSLKILEI